LFLVLTEANSKREHTEPASVAESNVILRAQRGEEAAFAALFERYKRQVYTFCLRMSGNPAEADDLSQAAFLQLFRRISTFRGESSFSTWLHRVVVNVVLMHLRKRGRRRALEDGWDTSRDETVERDYGDDDRRLAGSVDRLAITKAIEDLAPSCRTVLVLHDVEGYKHNEIAEIMKCSVGNSKSQLHRARLRLREVLRRDGHQPTKPFPAEERRASSELLSRGDGVTPSLSQHLFASGK
jgi:RNA polymerase sigma-70 factor, ECF subfamily